MVTSVVALDTAWICDVRRSEVFAPEHATKESVVPGCF